MRVHRGAPGGTRPVAERRRAASRRAAARRRPGPRCATNRVCRARRGSPGGRSRSPRRRSARPARPCRGDAWAARRSCAVAADGGSGRRGERWRGSLSGSPISTLTTLGSRASSSASATDTSTVRTLALPAVSPARARRLARHLVGELHERAHARPRRRAQRAALDPPRQLALADRHGALRPQRRDLLRDRLRDRDGAGVLRPERVHLVAAVGDHAQLRLHLGAHTRRLAAWHPATPGGRGRGGPPRADRNPARSWGSSAHGCHDAPVRR